MPHQLMSRLHLMIMQHQTLSIIQKLSGGRQKTDPTNGTVFYVNQFTGECTRDEPDIPSSSDSDSDSGQASPRRPETRPRMRKSLTRRKRLTLTLI